MRVGIVVWNDAHADISGSWVSIDDDVDVDPYQVVTVGIILDVDNGGKPGHVSVAQSITRDRFVDYTIHIPDAMVTSTTTLGEVKVEDGTITVHTKGRRNRSDVPASSRRSGR